MLCMYQLFRIGRSDQTWDTRPLYRSCLSSSLVAPNDTGPDDSPETRCAQPCGPWAGTTSPSEDGSDSMLSSDPWTVTSPGGPSHDPSYSSISGTPVSMDSLHPPAHLNPLPSTLAQRLHPLHPEWRQSPQQPRQPLIPMLWA